MRTTLLLFLFLYFNHAIAQNGVSISNTGNPPDASAMLDIQSTDKGLILPRVMLNSTNLAAPITSPALSLLVYNMNTAGSGSTAVTPGFYYWDGTQWVALKVETGGQGWALTGNTGTSSGTNFLGTTDNQSLTFKVNNTEKVRIEVNGTISTLNNGNSVFIGEGAGANDDQGNNRNVYIGRSSGASGTSNGNNVGIGYNTLLNNTAFGNTAIGMLALESATVGGNNTAVGGLALRRNLTGAFNTGIGYGSMFNNTTGNDNTAVGRNSLFNNKIGSYNTSIGFHTLQFNIANYNTSVGYYALNTNTSGIENTATGARALRLNTSGTNNTANGNAALRDNGTGSFNTAIGESAMRGNMTGNNNTAIGYNAFFTGAAYSNSTALGAEAAINASNKVRIGGTTVSVIEGQVAYSFPSDGRFKNNIKEEVAGLDFIMKLRPVVYNFDTEKFDNFLFKNVDKNTKNSIQERKDYKKSIAVRQSGFIAQEVESAAKETNYNFNGVHAPSSIEDNYSLSYSLFVVPLVKSIQEQQVQIEDLQNENNVLKSTITQQTIHIDENQAQIYSQQTQIEELKKIVNQLVTKYPISENQR